MRLCMTLLADTEKGPAPVAVAAAATVEDAAALTSTRSYAHAKAESKLIAVRDFKPAGL